MLHVRILAVLVSMALLALSCKTPEEGMIGEPPEDEEQTQIREGGPRRVELPGDRDRREPNTDHPSPIFAVDGWPYNDEANTFSLEWAGSSAVLSVHEAPSRNAAIVGEYAVQQGQEIPWRNTRINVFKPKIFETKQAVTIEGFRWAPDSRELHRQPVDAQVGAGTPVAVYHYQGGEQCIMGVGDKLVEAVCPTPDAFLGDFRGRNAAEKMQPDEKIWWVQITTQTTSGWIELDDRVAVDIEQL
ncbi:MAG: hypothetical protein ACQEVA_18190 [Myxococcota bacterium]